MESSADESFEDLSEFFRAIFRHHHPFRTFAGFVEARAEPHGITRVVFMRKPGVVSFDRGHHRQHYNQGHQNEGTHFASQGGDWSARLLYIR